MPEKVNEEVRQSVQVLLNFLGDAYGKQYGLHSGGELLFFFKAKREPGEVYKKGLTYSD